MLTDDMKEYEGLGGDPQRALDAVRRVLALGHALDDLMVLRVCKDCPLREPLGENLARHGVIGGSDRSAPKAPADAPAPLNGVISRAWMAWYLTKIGVGPDLQLEPLPAPWFYVCVATADGFWVGTSILTNAAGGNA